MVYTVYVGTFFRTSSTDVFRYVGMTELSLRGRGAKHVALPVAWGRGMKPGTLRLRAHKVCRTKKTALAEEARLAAALIHKDEVHVRGGPWSVSQIRAVHRKEMQMVLGCRSASEVIKHATEGGDLWKHLRDEPYRKDSAWKRRKPVTSGTKGKKLSGAQRRKRSGLAYGDPGYAAAKYGRAPKATEALIQARYNATRAGRPSGH